MGNYHNSSGKTGTSQSFIDTDNDGKIDTTKLKQLGFSDKQIDTIKANYNGNMTEENKKAIYSAVRQRHKQAGNAYKQSNLNNDGQEFMQQTRNRQLKLLQREGKDI